ALGYAQGLDDDDSRPYRAVERLMSEYYRHARAVLNFARQYLETGSQGSRFLSRVRSRFFSSRVTPFLSLLDGRLYLVEEPPGGAEKLAERMLSIFSLAHERNAELSESLVGWMRRKLAEVHLDFAHSPEVDQAFLRLLAGGRNVGRILSRMHETGVLGRILPEFGKLTCQVSFDGHHQFTVDEHTLRTLRELDRIECDLDYPEREFQRVLASIGDRLPLRLALLLHDIGKAGTGKHDARGTEAAVLICERLGLDEATIQTVEYLIYNHLLMHRYSERTDFTDDRVVESFGRRVERPERLAMLYLLTYIDIVSVGPGTWTAWKGAQLADLFERTRILLQTGAVPKSGKLEDALDSAIFDEARRRKVIEHCGLIENPAYARETIPE
ncbi:MAG: HD domain-containing protein, partial [Thermoanaerobaculia bacterium]